MSEIKKLDANLLTFNILVKDIVNYFIPYIEDINNYSKRDLPSFKFNVIGLYNSLILIYELFEKYIKDNDIEDSKLIDIAYCIYLIDKYILEYKTYNNIFKIVNQIKNILNDSFLSEGINDKDIKENIKTYSENELDYILYQIERYNINKPVDLEDTYINRIVDYILSIKEKE